jgi:hypothetical protein
MPKKTIASVDCEIPGGLSEFVSFESKASLLDWDVLLFNTSIASYSFSYEMYQGKPSLNDDRSFRLREAADHWKRELSEAFRAGKTVFVLLSEFQEVFIDTGQRQYSGTGRNRQTTRMVALFNNYQVLPIDITVTASEGRGIRLTREGELLADYWREFGDCSMYKVLIYGKIGMPLLVTTAGAKTVGSILQNRETGGALILLPYLNLFSEEFYEEEPASSPDEGSVSDKGAKDEDEEEARIVWTEKGTVFGHKLLDCLLAIDKTLREASATTPAPGWVNNQLYVLPKEAKLREELLKVESALEELATNKENLKTKIVKEGSLRRLLYEKGPPLEMAILQALQILGFRAESYRDSGSEFDAVFECGEGRLLGETEGKDNHSINVEKLRQLEMNIHEDFERDGVTEIAKGVLFGNAYRLNPLDKRGDYFTHKCMTAAKRGGTALVRTPDLFYVVQYLSEENDEEFAKKCREAILTTKGDIVTFPEIPVRSPESKVRKADD